MSDTVWNDPAVLDAVKAASLTAQRTCRAQWHGGAGESDTTCTRPAGHGGWYDDDQPGTHPEDVRTWA